MISQTVSHYKILEEIGRGAMGVVYRAEDTKLRRIVALKFLPPELTRDEEAKRRFIQEAQAASALDHPNICTIHEIAETDDGQLFIVMAFYEGETLRQKLASLEGKGLPESEALDIALQIARGLSEAHCKGIVHRDVKSANIMITKDGIAKILDFGLAKLVGQAQLTRDTSTLGTAAYMSPEQCRGEKVDGRTDIWSLGVVLYEMLTGKLPFRGEYEQAVIYSILNEEPEPIYEFNGSIAMEFEKIVKRCLKKDSRERYQTAADLQTNLERAKQDKNSGKPAIRLAKDTAPPPFQKLLRKIAAPLGVIILALLMLVLLPSSRQVAKKWLGFEAKSVAVLPFTVVGGDSADQAFCDGLVETLTKKLIQLEQFQKSLWVMPASVVRKYKITSGSEAQRVLGINLAITGNMQHFGDIIRLTLIRVDVDRKTPHQLRSPPITDPIGNLFTWQNKIVIELMKLLNIELQPQLRRALSAGGTTVPGAFEFYLQGRGYLQRHRQLENIDTAIRLFRRAIKQDSSYALAFAALGEAYWRKYRADKDIQWVNHAISCCNRALKLDDQMVSVHITLGLIHAGRGHYEEAVQDFQRALELDPVNVEAYLKMARSYEKLGKLKQAEMTYRKAIRSRPKYWVTHNNLGVFYYRQGSFEDAAKQFRKVVALTPSNFRGYNNLGGLYFELGRLEEARQMFERSLAIESNYRAYSNLGTLYFYESRYADAAQMYEKALQLSDVDYRVWGYLAASYYWISDKRDTARVIYKRAAHLAKQGLKVNPRDPEVLSDLADYFGMMGNRSKALSLLKQVLALKPSALGVMFRIGEIYEQLGKRDLAIKWIGLALEKGYSLAEIKSNPFLRDLRADERFQQLLHRNSKKP